MAAACALVLAEPVDPPSPLHPASSSPAISGSEEARVMVHLWEALKLTIASAQAKNASRTACVGRARGGRTALAAAGLGPMPDG
jgi:hypothetical protein